MNEPIDLQALRSPTDATFELTVRCNLKCKMCLFRHADCENGELMKNELTAEQWIGLAQQAADMGVGSLLLTGGEPMLRPDFPEIYRAIYKMGFILELYTNATLITPEIKALLTEYPPHKIGVTIYGADAETYEKVCGNGAAFQKAIDGARFLSTLPSVIKFRTTLICDNAESVDKIESLVHAEFGKEHTLTHTQTVFQSVRGACADVNLCRLSPAENTELMLRRMKKQARELLGDQCSDDSIDIILDLPSRECLADGTPAVSIFGCDAGMRSFCLTWDGKLLGCQLLGAFSTDALKEGLLGAWQSFPYCVHYDVEESKCKRCKLQTFCRTCPASRIAETGSFFGCSDYAYQDAVFLSQYYKTHKKVKNYDEL